MPTAARSWLTFRSALIASVALISNLGEPTQSGMRAHADDARPDRKYPGANIVFVSFDALQAAHVGCLGYDRPVTPTIDAMARRGFNFTHVSSVASWTVPASMTWFTGVYPSEHRMVNKFAVYNARNQTPANLKNLSPDLVTLAEILRAHGYATGGFTGNAGVSGGFGFEAGFDVYDYEKGKFGSLDRSVANALEWLKRLNGQKFFLFLHGYDVHGQCNPAGGFDHRFVDPGYDGKYTGAVQEQETLREEGLDRGQLELREPDVRLWRALYDEKIQRADAEFARFLAGLDALGLAGNTIFILTSDHGTELFEHRRIDHGFTLYEELLHVPLVIKLPGQKAGQTIEPRFSSIDVMPTVLDLLGIRLTEKQTAQMRGQSLTSAMNGEPAGRDLFAETDYREYTFKRSITTRDGWKLIFTLESGRRELYNLNADPGELDDRADTDPARADTLQQRLFAHFRAIGHDLSGPRPEVGLNPVYNSQAKHPPADPLIRDGHHLNGPRRASKRPPGR